MPPLLRDSRDGQAKPGKLGFVALKMFMISTASARSTNRFALETIAEAGVGREGGETVVAPTPEGYMISYNAVANPAVNCLEMPRTSSSRPPT